MDTFFVTIRFDDTVPHKVQSNYPTNEWGVV